MRREDCGIQHGQQQHRATDLHQGAATLSQYRDSLRTLHTDLQPCCNSRNAGHLSDVLVKAECVSCLQAEEYNAALVVMAAHNKGRLLKYLLGSATKFCVNHCRSTVLVHHL